MYRKFFKRFFDFILSLLALIILSPILLILIILGYFYMGGNPFFTQERPGKNGEIFKLIKFRTMDNRKDKDGNLLPDEVRLNRYGKMLRKTSLDELPELINILKGDMSIIGPRPLLVEYLPYYTEEEMHRHDVRPGLTGLAQVSGRNLLNWEARFKKDLEYIDNISLKEDVKIILMSVKKVLFKEDITECPSKQLTFKSLDEERRIVGDKIIKLRPRILRKYKDNIFECLGAFEDKTNVEKMNIVENMQKYVSNGSANVYAYFLEDQIVGFVWGYEISNKTIHINYFCVVEQFRNKNIGSKLLETFTENFKGFKFELLVEKNNVKAINFYKKNGFSLTEYNDIKYKMHN